VENPESAPLRHDNLAGRIHGEIGPFADDDCAAPGAEVTEIHAARCGKPIRRGIGPAGRRAAEAQHHRGQK
jgi:hypothetical protein